MTTPELRTLPTYGKTLPLERGQVWAVLHGGIHSTFKIVEILPGKYLRPPDVALIPTEFCRIEWLDGHLKGQTTDQRAPGHRLGWAGGHVLLREPSALDRWLARKAEGLRPT